MKINERAEKEFAKIISMQPHEMDFINENYTECLKIFKYLYLINYFKNKAETKRFFRYNFNLAFSLMLEAVYVLYSGHTKASLLILRSAQEITLKSIIKQEREWINSITENTNFKKLDYRFTENKTIFVNDISPYISKEQYNEYFVELDRTVGIYKELSGIVHSGNEKMDFQVFSYFSSLTLKNNNINETFDMFNKTFKSIFRLICFMMRDSLSEWDTYELHDVFSLVIKKEKSRANFIKAFK